MSKYMHRKKETKTWIFKKGMWIINCIFIQQFQNGFKHWCWSATRLPPVIYDALFLIDLFWYANDIDIYLIMDSLKTNCMKQIIPGHIWNEYEKMGWLTFAIFGIDENIQIISCFKIELCFIINPKLMSLWLSFSVVTFYLVLWGTYK